MKGERLSGNLELHDKPEIEKRKGLGGRIICLRLQEKE
jgi:hypothetical protein